MNALYKDQLESFTQWLERLGLQCTTSENYRNYLSQFFQWLEKENIPRMEEITTTHLERYQIYLEKRKNQVRGGALNQNTINNHIQALQRFNTYRIKYNHEALPVHGLRMGKPLELSRQILTLHEIQCLYDATDNTAYGYRDRAILSIFYGCGLRCKEGVSLMLDDVDLRKRYVHVRKGKGNKERHVPISKSIAEHLADYLYNGRSVLMKEKHNFFWVGQKGKPLEAMGMRLRLKKMLNTAGINKAINLHGLRHSLATHLLQSGMDIEKIAQFLGHVQLQTTQIYTHLADEL